MNTCFVACGIPGHCSTNRHVPRATQMRASPQVPRCKRAGFGRAALSTEEAGTYGRRVGPWPPLGLFMTSPSSTIQAHICLVGVPPGLLALTSAMCHAQDSMASIWIIQLKRFVL